MRDTKITAVMVLDVIGRPPEHLVETLEGLAKEIDGEKGVTVKLKSIKEPTLMKDQKDFYTTFAEIEVEVEEMIQLALLLFKYMPAHFEIVEPEMLVLSNSGWNEIFNELARRLHGYDEIARIMQVEKQMLLKKIQELGGNLNELFSQPQPPAEKISKKESKKKIVKKKK